MQSVLADNRIVVGGDGRQLIYVPMAGQGAGGQAAILCDVGKGQRRQRRLLGGFQHRRIADRQGRDHGPADDLHRIVPRDDVARHPVRLTQGVNRIAVEEGDGLAVQLVRRPGVEFQIPRQGDHVGPRLFQRLADIQRFKLGQHVDARLDLAAHARQHPPALDRRRPPPWPVQRRARGLNRRVDVLGPPRRQSTQSLAIRRVFDGQDTATVRRDPLAADKNLIGMKGRDHQVLLTITARRRERSRRSGHDYRLRNKPFIGGA